MRYEKFELERFPPKQKLRMLQNAVGDVMEFAYIKQIGDQDIARGHPPLSYDSYMDLLLSACSTYDKKITLPGKQKRAVYASETSSDNLTYPFDDTTDGEYEVFQVDTAVDDIMAFTTDKSKGGYQGKPNLNFIPRDEWDKLSQDQKDQLIAKRRQERMKQNGGNWKSNQPRRQVNVHDVNDLVHVDTFIDYAIMNHDVVPPTFTEETTDESPTTDADTLLAYMAGRGPEGTTGDIRNVLAAKREPDNKSKSRTANESKAAPITVKIGDTTY
jgi:hypothetical protein